MRSAALLLTPFMLFFATPGFALVYQFEGTITQPGVSPGGALPPGLVAALPLGTPVRIEYAFDPDAPNIDRDPAFAGTYAVDRVELTVGARSFVVDGLGLPGDPRIRTLPGTPSPIPGPPLVPASYGLDAFDLAAPGTFPDAFGIHRIEVGLGLLGQVFPAPTLFTTEILGQPPATFQLEFRDGGGDPFRGVRFEGAGTFSAVPEPGTALLVGLGIAALSSRRSGPRSSY